MTLPPRPRSELYGNLLPLVNSRRVRLLNNKRLIGQLLGLERRARAALAVTASTMLQAVMTISATPPLAFWSRVMREEARNCVSAPSPVVPAYQESSWNDDRVSSPAHSHRNRSAEKDDLGWVNLEGCFSGGRMANER